MLPVITPGVIEVLPTVTLKQDGAEMIAQEFVAVTHILPLAAPEVATMLVVPCPAVMVHPVGTVHVYAVAPETALMV
jgi:hypothetical protein